MFKIINREKKTHAIQYGAVGNIAEQQWQKFNKEGSQKANIDAIAVQQTKISPKYNNKNKNLITNLSNLYY